MKKIFFMGLLIIKMTLSMSLFAQAFPLYKANDLSKSVGVMLKNKRYTTPLASFFLGISIVASNLGSYKNLPSEDSLAGVVDQGIQAVPFQEEWQEQQEQEAVEFLGEVATAEEVTSSFILILSLSALTLIIAPIPALVAFFYEKNKKMANISYAIKEESGDLVCKGIEPTSIPFRKPLNWNHLKGKCGLRVGKAYYISLLNAEKGVGFKKTSRFVFQ